MSKTKELCQLANKMEYIQSFKWKRKYILEEDYLRTDVTLILAPCINYIGEKCFKITFCGVCDLKCYGLERTIFHPVITITDISDRHWENCHYFVQEVEDEFQLKCDYFEYEWIVILD